MDAFRAYLSSLPENAREELLITELRTLRRAAAPDPPAAAVNSHPPPAPSAHNSASTSDELDGMPGNEDGDDEDDDLPEDGGEAPDYDDEAGGTPLARSAIPAGAVMAELGWSLGVYPPEEVAEIQRCVDLIGTLMGPVAHECPFDWRYLATFLVHAARKAGPPSAALGDLPNPRNWKEVQKIVAGGDTQSRKTLFAFVQVCAGWVMGITTIILTQHVKGRNGLYSKLKSLMEEANAGDLLPHFRCIGAEVGDNGQKRLGILSRYASMKLGGAVVINDTAPRLDRVKEVVAAHRGSQRTDGKVRRRP